MNFKIPKETDKFSWTKHSIDKMKYYGLPESRVKQVVLHPSRTEYGIAPETLASMKPRGTTKHTYEAWVMYQVIYSKPKLVLSGAKQKKFKIISAWKYPGISPKGQEIPIPEEMRDELMEELAKLKNG